MTAMTFRTKALHVRHGTETVFIPESYNNKPLVCIFETELLGHLWTDLSEIADRDQGWV